MGGSRRAGCEGNDKSGYRAGLELWHLEAGNIQTADRAQLKNSLSAGLKTRGQEQATIPKDKARKCRWARIRIRWLRSLLRPGLARFWRCRLLRSEAYGCESQACGHAFQRDGGEA